MSQSQPDRLDRIEATLERVSQQLDNQVVLNVELRQSNAQLQQRTTEIANAVNSLIETANQHQENFAVIVTEIRNMRQNMEQMQSEIVELRQDTRNLQAENRRILEHLENRE